MSEEKCISKNITEENETERVKKVLDLTKKQLHGMADRTAKGLLLKKLMHELYLLQRSRRKGYSDIEIITINGEYDLTEEEADIYRRGRNAKSPTMAKNAKMADYRKATGFEALCGYLYLCGQTDRLKELFSISAFDMESGALGAVCYLLNVPFVSIRKISDSADDVGVEDYTNSVSTDVTAFSDIVLRVLEKI